MYDVIIVGGRCAGAPLARLLAGMIDPREVFKSATLRRLTGSAG